ncbi:MAG: SpoIID/LytB domain-containing protein [Candidatus Rifleibacteriota bacterium]
MLKTGNNTFLVRWLQATLLFAFCTFVSFAYADAREVSIKVAQYNEKIDFNCNNGAAWELGGVKGQISSGDRCSLQAELKEKAQKKYHVMVSSVGFSESEQAQDTLKKWQKAGYKCENMVLGKILKTDQSQLTFDNRKLATSIGVFDDKKSAQALVDKLAAQGKSSWIHTEIVSLAQGSLKLFINNQFKAVGNNLLVIPEKEIELKEVEYAAGYPWHGFEDRTYAGPVSIRFGAWDAIDCILKASLEKILAGVVPSEISAYAATGALRAQAVAARGEILAKIGIRHQGEGFDICSEQHCQVYKGETKYSKMVEPKIAPTAGYVLTHNGDIVEAVYSANCGGHTEANHYVWTTQPDPVLSGVWDHNSPPSLDLTEEEQVGVFIKNPPQNCYCASSGVPGSHNFRWQKAINETEWKEIENKLGVGRIKGIKNIARGLSGRIYQMTFIGQFDNKTLMKELNIRRMFGSLKSACFVLHLQKDSSGFVRSAELDGAGFGHGVGMCQTGAQSMAKKGLDFKTILLHYYPVSRLQKWY